MSLKNRALILLVLIISIPIVMWLVLPKLPSLGQPAEIFSGGTAYPASPVKFERATVGAEPAGLPLITNVQILDFDGDGQNEILACDSGRSIVSLFQKEGPASWQEKVLITGLAAPAHATAVDIDADGDLDIIVSILGNLMPDDRVIGRV